MSCIGDWQAFTRGFFVRVFYYVLLLQAKMLTIKGVQYSIVSVAYPGFYQTTEIR